MSRLRPVFHFFVLGGLLFMARSVLDARHGLGPREPVTVTADRVEQWRSDFLREWGQPPSSGQLSAFVRERVTEELLDREARRLHLGLGDVAIRQRLIQKMRAVTSDLSLADEELFRQAMDLGLDDDVVVRRQLREKMRLLLRQGQLSQLSQLSQKPPAYEPSDAELLATLERYRERFERDATLDFAQVFVSKAVHGDACATRAEAVALQIHSRALTPGQALELTDPFPLDGRWRGRPRAEIARRFGDVFAERIWSLEPGSWSMPIPSLYGLHLVYVDQRRDGGLPPLDVIRHRVARLWEEERSAIRLAAGVQRLHELYQVHVEWPEADLPRDLVAESQP